MASSIWRTGSLATALIVLLSGNALGQSDTAKKSPLDRTKTKLTPVAPKSNASKPAGGLKPTGKTPSVAQPPIRTPIQRPVDGPRDAGIGPSGGRLVDLPHHGTQAEIGPILDLRPGSGAARVRDALRDAAQRGELPHSNQELRDFTASASADVDAIRAQYHDKGFMEVRVGENQIVMIKGADWCAVAEASDAVRNEVSVDSFARAIDEWEKRGRRTDDWVFSDTFSRQAAASNAGSALTSAPTTYAPGVIDAFVLKSTLRPEKPLTETERAELDLTDIERAEYALHTARYDLAIDRYEVYLKGTNQEDSGAIRGMAIAMLQGRRLVEGIKRIGDAYRLDPMLASRPLVADDFDDGVSLFNSLVQRVVPMANRSKDYDASLAAIVVFQAQGRHKEAARMLQRAKERGLPEPIAREFSAALTDPDSAAGSLTGAVK